MASRWTRPATQGRALLPPAHALRSTHPHTLFFDFRAHPQLSPDDIVHIFSDESLVYSEDVIGIRFVPAHRLAQVTFRGPDAVAHHLQESGSADSEIRCFEAIDPARPICSIWLRGTPLTEPELLVFCFT